MFRSLPIIFAFFLVSPLAWAEAYPSIPRRIPPQGIEIPFELRSRLEDRLLEIAKAPERIRRHPDVEIFRKAVRFAILN
ncbi:MAG: hypothetical protein AAEJ57_08265, partial [Opitutales bacterium]